MATRALGVELARLESLKAERGRLVAELDSANFRVEYGRTNGDHPETTQDGACLIPHDEHGSLLDTRKMRELIHQNGIHLVIEPDGSLKMDGARAVKLPPPKKTGATTCRVRQERNLALVLEQSYIDEMIAHAKEEAPNECCGIIAGKDGRATKLYRAINAEASPYRYSVDTKDLLRIHKEVDGNDWDFLVIYHSHTHTEAYPSPTDVRLATWPGAYYVLVSLMNEAQPTVRAFRIEDAAITEEPIELA